MNYYKILNDNEKHQGLQYKTGLNVDPIPFNPFGDREPGGIYFAEKDILGFIDYGPWIRKVIIPEDAQIYENPNLPKEWKADKVILEERRRIDVKVIQKLINEGADPKAGDSRALQWAAENGHIGLVKSLIPISNTKMGYTYALMCASRIKHLEIAKLLIPIADIDESLKTYISHCCENQKIRELILNHE